MNEIKLGFEPFYRVNSRLLILGSFPSVKSREVEFYYGNRRNRFWSTLAQFFGESEPKSVEEKKKFLLSKQVALWDVVAECEIVGSQDSTIKNYKVADVEKLLQKLKIELIILNGGKAYSVFVKHFPNIAVPYIKLQSTSPANTSFTKEEWFDALSRVFRRN